MTDMTANPQHGDVRTDDRNVPTAIYLNGQWRMVAADETEHALALNRFVSRIRQIEADHEARMRALSAQSRRFAVLWLIVTSCAVVNILWIHEPLITWGAIAINLAWAANALIDLHRMKRRQRELERVRRDAEN